MIKFSIDREGVTPLHEQLKNQIRLELAVGHLRPGDYLPSIRQADEQFEEMFSFLQGNLRQRGLVPAGFGRFLMVRMTQAEQERAAVAVIEESQTLADDHAKRLREALQIPLTPYRLDDFNRLSPAKRSWFSCLLSDYSVIPALKIATGSNAADSSAGRRVG